MKTDRQKMVMLKLLFQADSFRCLAGFQFPSKYTCSCWHLQIHYAWSVTLLGLY